MLQLKNRYYQLTVDESAGKIASLCRDGNNLLSEQQPALFEIQFRDEVGGKMRYSAADALSFSVKKEDESIRLSYRLPDDITVTLTVKNDGTAFSKWSADVESEAQLEWLEYPCISVPDTFADRSGKSKLLWAYNEGALIEEITPRGYEEPEYPSRGSYAMCPGMIFAPLMAVLSEKGGLYFAAHDTAQNTRNVDYYRSEQGVRLRMRVFPGVDGGCYSSSEEHTLGIFDGENWYQAAEIYRTWFTAHKPERLLPISENKRLPEWYSDSPIVLAYCVRGRYDTAVMEPNGLFPYIKGLDLVDKMAERLQSRIMVILMHWEGSAPWAPPYVWPPYGGEDALKEYIDALHAKGHLLGVYCSGFGWTQTSNIADYHKEQEFEERNLKEYMCISPEGDLPLSNICNDQRYGYDICPAKPFLYNTLTNEVQHMAAAGIDYAQLLDQNHGGTPYMCYSKHHGHPPVPGNWETKAAADILQKIQRDIGDKKMLFGCESSAAEYLIPELLFSDNRYELCYYFGKPVPLYAYLYHEYLHNFMGNQVCAEYLFQCRNPKNKDNLLFRLAYSFAAGDYMTLVVNDLGQIQWAWGQSNFSKSYMPNQDNALDFVRELNAWRKGKAYKYLHNGKMLAPIPLRTESIFEMQLKFGEIIESALVTARYQADDGSIAQIIVNPTTEAVVFTVAQQGNYTVSFADGSQQEITSQAVTVAPLSAILMSEN